jgi:LmbE family N-acetylglucosaminyl deacetylase
MKTLILAPHADDEAISTGALIQNRVNAGGDVTVLFLFGRTSNFGLPHPDQDHVEIAQAQELLGYQVRHCENLREGEPLRDIGYYKLLVIIEKLIQTLKPQEIVCPSSNDLNQDHRFVNEIVRIATRACNMLGVKRILQSRAFDGNLTEPTWYEIHDESVMGVKLGAVGCYKSEVRQAPHPRSERSIVALHQVMGSKVFQAYAEPYDVLKIVN